MSAKVVTAALSGTAICCATAIFLMGGSGLKQLAGAVTNASDHRYYPGEHFYNSDVANDDVGGNDHNFGPSAFEDVTSGSYSTLYGELLDRMDYTGEDDPKGYDPCLMSAVAFAIDLTRGTNLMPESHDTRIPIGERPNTAVERLRKSEQDRQDLYDNLKAQFESAEVSMEELGRYTSQMYQLPIGYYPDRPAITVHPDGLSGGHALIFKWDDGKVVKLRLECGYQPTEVPGWDPPKPSSPTPTNPPGTNPPEETLPPPPMPTDPTNPPPPVETTSPPITTTLQPKNPGEAPPVQNDPDIGGTVRADDINTTPSPEPDINQLPTSYVAPPPPTAPRPTTTVETTKQATEPPTPTTAPTKPTEPQVTHDGKTYTQAPPQVTNPPLEDVNDNAPTAAGVDNNVQTGTIPVGALDRFG